VNTNLEIIEQQKHLDDKVYRFDLLVMLRRAFGAITRIITPGYSYCGKCGITWKFVKGHSTNYTNSRGCFPLCEHCWELLTPEERLPYYKDLWDSWHGWGKPDVEWKTIKEAVLSEAST
jgi:hypothetical protein